MENFAVTWLQSLSPAEPEEAVDRNLITCETKTEAVFTREALMPGSNLLPVPDFF